MGAYLRGSSSKCNTAERMLRKVLMMRRVLHVKGDVMCTLLLLVLLCFLLYTRQVVLSSGGSRPVWKLEIHDSTSSSRILLGSSGAKLRNELHESLLPSCIPQLNFNPRQSRSSSEIRSRSRRKKVPPTRAADKLPTLPPFDFKSYLREKDRRNFKLLIDQPKKCRIREEEEGGGGSAPYMLIAVKSIAADFDKRQVVRQTWGKEGMFQPGRSVRTVFLLGIPRNRSSLPWWDRLLAYESQAYQDILLWNFEDTFFNLTLKETHFLEWVNSSCAQVKFIFKGDADVYVNVENILEMLQGREPDEDLFVGDIIVNAKPIRRRTSKYYVPEFMYGGLLYPSYAGGGGFVMSGHTARRLNSACQQVELFPIDDVFLGMCLQLIGISPLRHQGFRTFGIPRPSAAPHLQTFDPCFYRELMVVHSLSVPQIWLMWNLLHDPDLSCHNRTGLTSGPFKWRGRIREMTGDEADYGEKPEFITH
ncbi:PREDICTED: UDP-GlcNAc:betaGal beta-1,3-N-acetylglucosaminyltransferase 9 isoform X1 [Cyprinodon variegatus]|uniref:Hexosyltransferase n=1 Tax=Cyprinodon variegatus TaxID=28743 RepID=A0A3Q2DC86_CYPVA|nr:PREDICTED: UDP-GlcNAc:betaGal beta-1,3-N-acetylglucosaminyltransferase 9 isoform X1 [Cyprinodon variegatus]XP_015252862.1 PREDICTED: UDP-GlcNAc:betaGal beta-1,3-N-acetylglucosaminyltransferase 9 isoform X1 [Cyprinodon variegatus]XP_015252863.1 PREDICTED: UDP-GlcNAc:betaGal beta-1,3-N-acetylglucosaminyltransferase 9 isoform X1 [Cyprinodon variegatus]